jgi:hypothetical protein
MGCCLGLCLTRVCLVKGMWENIFSAPVEESSMNRTEKGKFSL